MHAAEIRGGVERWPRPNSFLFRGTGLAGSSVPALGSKGWIIPLGRWHARGMRAAIGLCCVALLGCAAGEAREAGASPGSNEQSAAWSPAPAPLMTRWGRAVTPENVWPEYPRPQMRRRDWLSLNGLWELGVPAGSDASGAARPARILVPFPVESALSGVGERLEWLAYRRSFEVPGEWRGRRVLLQFGAVDWMASVRLNGTELGTHRGGYDPFGFDVTDALRPEGPQVLEVLVYDPSDGGDQPRGKQVEAPEGIWYTPSSGIWQSVWLEPVPAARIARLRQVPDLERGELRLKIELEGAREGDVVEATALEGGRSVARASAGAGTELVLRIEPARAWSPEDPFLYDLRVRLARDGESVDEVESYFGLRSIRVGLDGAGVPRLFFNGAPLFQVGLLDQGFWPDGLYSAPSDAALSSDIEQAKALGFNLLRKHVKVEPERWYYHCDRLGMLVWQDMPSGNSATAEGRAQFQLELERMLAALENHPSIVQWVVFNEGWGQHDTPRLVELVRSLDATRPICNASGWTDAGVGEVIDLHAYPGPAAPAPEAARALVLGEFGGLGLGVSGHTWIEETWGYRGMADSDELTRRFEGLLREAWRLNEQAGLSAAVYTQVSDVESECNGLVSYDRELVKADAERVRRANRGELPALVPIAPTSEAAAAAWRFRFDPPAPGWREPEHDDSAWAEGPGGFGTEATPGAVVRTVWSTPEIWLRRRFLWDGEPPGELTLALHHDEDVEVHLNGEPLLSAPGYTTGYELWPLGESARALLRPGENVLAVHCRQTSGGQYVDLGLFGSPPR